MKKVFTGFKSDTLLRLYENPLVGISLLWPPPKWFLDTKDVEA